jgi:hypothetical protein
MHPQKDKAYGSDRQQTRNDPEKLILDAQRVNKEGTQKKEENGQVSGDQASAPPTFIS